jgi:hypothetical protein
VELAPLDAPAEIAPVVPIPPVEAPVEQPAAFETVDAVAPIEEPAAFDTVAPIETMAPVEADAPVEHVEPTPFAVEPVTETATNQVAEIAHEPETLTGTDQVAEITDEPETETVQDVETTQTTRFRVVIRLSGAEPVEAGAFDAVGEAKDCAFEIVGQLTSENGSWPYFRGRYLRPDAIVSVDIVEETAW